MEATVAVEALKQAPALTVLVVVVWMFLNKLTVFTDALKELHKEHIDARALSREAIHENTRAMNENTIVITKLVERLECVNKPS